MSSTSGVSLEMANLTNLTGRVALVTGGGTGIGLMIAKGLATSGAKVYISGRRLEVVQKAASEHKFEGSGSLVPIRMDVNDKSSIFEGVKYIEEADGKLDVLVNNAGIPGPNSLGIWSVDSGSVPDSKAVSAYGMGLFEQTFEQWDSVARTNVASVFFVTAAFLGLLAKSAEGIPGRTASVINISSLFAHSRLNWGGFYAYTCLKAATSHMTKMFATDLSMKRAPIRVNVISPGCFPSELTPQTQNFDELLQGSFLGSPSPHPMRRAGREEEMAALAVYLASSASEYVRGQDIVLDGGFVMVNP